MSEQNETSSLKSQERTSLPQNYDQNTKECSTNNSSSDHNLQSGLSFLYNFTGSSYQQDQTSTQNILKSTKLKTISTECSFFMASQIELDSNKNLPKDGQSKEDVAQSIKNSHQNSFQKKLTKQQEYQQFRQSYDISIEDILQKLKNINYIKINRTQKQMFESQKEGRIQIENLYKQMSISIFYAFVSIFRIQLSAIYINSNLPYNEIDAQYSGGFGHTYFQINHKGAEGCFKIIKFQKYCKNLSQLSITKHQVIFECLKQIGFLKLASALGIGPKFYQTQVGMFRLQQEFTYVDLVIYQNGVCFQTEKCRPLFYQMQQIRQKYKQQNQKQLKLEEQVFKKHLSEAILILHKLKIVHNDIKPDNIVYSSLEKKYLLIDFGLCHPVKETYENQTRTFFKGTIGYCSPQMLKLLQNPKRIGKVNLYRNDLYGFIKALEDFKNKIRNKKQYEIYQQYKFKQSSHSEHQSQLKYLESNSLLSIQKITIGWSSKIHLLWLLQTIDSNKSQSQKSNLQNKMRQYKLKIQKQKNYKLTQKLKTLRRMRAGLNSEIQQVQDIETLFIQLNFPETKVPDYQKVLFCLMNLKRVRGLIQIDFSLLKTQIREVIFYNIFQNIKGDNLKQSFYVIVNFIFQVIIQQESFSQVSKWWIQKLESYLSNFLAISLSSEDRKQWIINYLSHLCIFCCHFNFQKVLDFTLNYLKSINRFKDEYTLSMLNCCMQQLMRHPETNYIQILSLYNQIQELNSQVQKLYGGDHLYNESIIVKKLMKKLLLFHFDYNHEEIQMLVYSIFFLFQNTQKFDYSIPLANYYSYYVLLNKRLNLKINQQQLAVLKNIIKRKIYSASIDFEVSFMKINKISRSLTKTHDIWNTIQPMLNTVKGFAKNPFFILTQDFFQYLFLQEEVDLQKEQSRNYNLPIQINTEFVYRMNLYFFPHHQFLVYSKILNSNASDSEILKDKLMKKHYNIKEDNQILQVQRNLQLYKLFFEITATNYDELLFSKLANYFTCNSKRMQLQNRTGMQKTEIMFKLSLTQSVKQKLYSFC